MCYKCTDFFTLSHYYHMVPTSVHSCLGFSQTVFIKIKYALALAYVYWAASATVALLQTVSEPIKIDFLTVNLQLSLQANIVSYGFGIPSINSSVVAIREGIVQKFFTHFK